MFNLRRRSHPKIASRTPNPGQAAIIIELGKTLAEPSEPWRARIQTIDTSQTKKKKALVNTAPQIPAKTRPSGVIPIAMAPIVNIQGDKFGGAVSNSLTGSSVGHFMMHRLIEQMFVETVAS